MRKLSCDCSSDIPSGVARGGEGTLFAKRHLPNRMPNTRRFAICRYGHVTVTVGYAAALLMFASLTVPLPPPVMLQ